MSRHILRPALSRLKAEVVHQKHMCKDHLDLICSEEATGARVLAMSEVQVIHVRGRELVAGVLAGLLALLVVSETIECLRVRRHVWIVKDLGARHAESRASRKVEAVRQSHRFERDTVKSHW